MLKGLAAIIAAAVSAGVVVGLIPEPEPAAAAATSRPIPRNQAANSAAVVAAMPACVQPWPYYEQSCLRDSRQMGGGASTARVISTSYSVKALVCHIARLAGGSR
jgi:hypothetical protein